MNVLIVEDDDNTARAIALMVKSHDHSARIVHNGADAIEWARSTSFDIVLIDLGLPDIAGLDVLKALRSSRVFTPAIVVSGLSAIEVRCAALRAGADDFIVKPFHSEELLARIEAVTRRTNGAAVNTIECGPLRFDLLDRSITIDGRASRLTPMELRYFEVLVRAQGRTVSKVALLDAVYLHNETPVEKIIDVVICAIRRKLRHASGGLDFIETIWGIGYQFRKEPVEFRDLRAVPDEPRDLPGGAAA